jgi:hypothetical protein
MLKTARGGALISRERVTIETGGRKKAIRVRAAIKVSMPIPNILRAFMVYRG